MVISFEQWCDQINGGKPYSNSPPPVSYQFADYESQITSSPIGNKEGSGHELRPLTHDDMCRYGHDDVVDHYKKIHNTKSPTALGKPMTDTEFKKFMGINW